MSQLLDEHFLRVILVTARRSGKIKFLVMCVCQSVCSQGVPCDHYHDALDLTVQGHSLYKAPVLYPDSGIPMDVSNLQSV